MDVMTLLDGFYDLHGNRLEHGQYYTLCTMLVVYLGFLWSSLTSYLFVPNEEVIN